MSSIGLASWTASRCAGCSIGRRLGSCLPTYLSTDHDPLYGFHQWQANLRILNIQEIKTVPYVPRSHPIVERLIGTVRRECLDRRLFWTAADLERTLVEFQQHYNDHRMRGAQDARRRQAWTRLALGRIYSVQRIAGSRIAGLYPTPRAA
jgi:hypothetical protein